MDPPWWRIQECKIRPPWFREGPRLVKHVETSLEHVLPTSKLPPRMSSIEGRCGAREVGADEVGADEVAAALKDRYPIYQIGVGRYEGDLNGNPDMNS